MQTRLLYITLLLLFVIQAAAVPEGIYEKFFLRDDTAQTLSRMQGDSLMRNVINHAETYKKALSQYETEIYIKGQSEILKQNFLMMFAHHLFPVNRKNKNLIFEMTSLSRFEAPSRYVHDIQAINGNDIPNTAKQHEVLTFLNLNVYAPTVYNEKIIMPVAKEAFRYYYFSLEETFEEEGLIIHKIRIMPRLWSQKLICGYLYVTDEDCRIDKIDLNGRSSFAEFNLEMTFNRDSRYFILPRHADLFLRYNVLGNAIVSNYHTSYNFKSIEWIDENYEKKPKRSLDLTGYYQISSDTIPIIRDELYWDEKRDIPLTFEDKLIYEQVPAVAGSKKDTTNKQKYLKLTEKMVNTINLDYKSTRMKYSGILNPFQLGYSGTNGITYRQQLRISKEFENDRLLRIKPEIGYVFKRKELFFKLEADFEYLPVRRGTISVSAGNANQSYSSKIMNDINEQLKDSIFNFKNLDLRYFKHYFVEVKNKIELFHGFEMMTSVSYHRRTPAFKSKLNAGPGVNNIINENYHDFIPAIGISYTPRQYYWMDGKRKEYLRSNYPTITVEFAHAIPGVFNCAGNYGRVEAGIHHSFNLGLTRKFNYHVSGGLFTGKKTTYFADFTYFTKRYFPESWGGDDFGGVFHQLGNEWFNASDRYAQLHVMYESPFMIMQRIKPQLTKHILTERFYFSQLWTPVLPSFTEVGYGFGNHIFNIAGFVGFDRWKYDGFGIRFAFELFQ